MTMTNQGDEAVRLVPGEASKKSGLPGEASMRTPLTGSSSFQLSSRMRRKLVGRCSLRSTGLAARRLTSHLRPPSLANAAPACWPRSTELDAAKRMRCPSRPRARLSASSATSKSTALGARALKRRALPRGVGVWAGGYVRRDRVFFLGVGFPYR